MLTVYCRDHANATRNTYFTKDEKLSAYMVLTSSFGRVLPVRVGSKSCAKSNETRTVSDEGTGCSAALCVSVRESSDIQENFIQCKLQLLSKLCPSLDFSVTYHIRQKESSLLVLDRTLGWKWPPKLSLKPFWRKLVSERSSQHQQRTEEAAKRQYVPFF